jgi:hypothetical protein
MVAVADSAKVNRMPLFKTIIVLKYKIRAPVIPRGIVYNASAELCLENARRDEEVERCPDCPNIPLSLSPLMPVSLIILPRDSLEHLPLSYSTHIYMIPSLL